MPLLSDPTNAIASGGVNVSRYQAAVQELKSLASLPETSDTPQQKAERRRTWGH